MTQPDEESAVIPSRMRTESKKLHQVENHEQPEDKLEAESDFSFRKQDKMNVNALSGLQKNITELYHNMETGGSDTPGLGSGIGSSGSHSRRSPNFHRSPQESDSRKSDTEAAKIEMITDQTKKGFQKTVLPAHTKGKDQDRVSAEALPNKRPIKNVLSQHTSP